MKSPDLIWERIDRIGRNPRRIPEPFGTVLFSLPDVPAFLFQNGCRALPLLPHFAPFYYRYGRNFKRRIFEVSSGVRMDAVHAQRPGSRTLVVLVHGIFQSKNFKFIRDMAHSLYEHHSVVVVDTRDHLGTFSLSSGYPASAGTIEGGDILAICRQLRQENGADTRIFIVGFSYGGGIVLNSIADEKAGETVKGIVAVSPTMVMDHAVSHIDKDPGFTSPFYPMYSLFQTCLRLRYGMAMRSFREYLEKAALRYGLSPEEMLERSSLPALINRIRVPALLLVAKDDPVIPAGDAERMYALSKGNDFVHLIIADRGGHIGFAFIDKSWFYGLLEEFIGSRENDR